MVHRTRLIPVPVFLFCCMLVVPVVAQEGAPPEPPLRETEAASLLADAEAKVLSEGEGAITYISLPAKSGDNVLAVAARLPQLTYLDLAKTSVTDAGIAGLSGLSNLQTLRLGHTDISSAALQTIGRLEALRTLTLQETGVADQGLAHLAKLAYLTELRLDGSGVTDAGIEHLAKLTSLERLWLQRTQVTTAGIQKLKQALPQTLIFHTTGQQAAEGESQ